MFTPRLLHHIRQQGNPFGITVNFKVSQPSAQRSRYDPAVSGVVMPLFGDADSSRSIANECRAASCSARY